MKNKKTDVLILAAGSIQNKLYFSNFVFNSPALLPINVRSVISYILDFYIDKDVNINIVINSRDKDTIQNEISYYKGINLIPLNDSDSVVDSLIQACSKIEILDDIIVNIVTTIPTKIPKKNTVLLSNSLELNANWSGVVLDNKITNFVYKNEKKQVVCNAFTGLFRCTYNNLQKCFSQSTPKKDLLTIVETMHNSKNMLFEKYDWLDCGHELNFYDAKAKLISSRSFNGIKIEPVLGLITKYSRNIKKFSDEIHYIQLLPEDISILFPAILGDLQVTENYGSVQMEYYGYSTIAEYMLYWNIQDYIWNKIFKSLLIVLKKFKQHKYSIGKNAHKEFYYNKTFSRVEEFKQQISLENSVFADEIIVNGYKCKSIDLLKNQIIKKINTLYCEDDFCIMHGDLCFNNILYDIKSGIIRLIDARGSFGDSCIGIYGDIKYDLAKLTHSIMGGYDFLVNNLFSLKYEDNNYTYSIITRENYTILCDLNVKMIIELGYEKEDILFLVGLLFVSMCPLHNDDKNRQLIMYIHGLKYLNESLGE